MSSSKLLEGLPFEASAKKGSRTPTSPVVRTASFQDAATRCLRSASARRRSTCGSSQRDVGPKGSGPGQASWDVVTRMIRKSGLPVFRPDHPQLNKLLGVIQCLLSQSSGSTPRTGRNAGEHDARTRPRAECMAPRRRRTRSTLVEYPRPKAPLSERDLAFRTEMGTSCQWLSDYAMSAMT